MSPARLLMRVLASALALLLAAGAQAAGLSAGAGRAEIAIPAAALPADGFTAVHDPLQARVVVLDDGHLRAALVVLDLTSLDAASIASARRIVAERAQVPADNTWVIASHTFSAPHVMANPHADAAAQRQYALLQQALDTAVGEATERARAGLRPARLGVGSGTSRVNVNRDQVTAQGWWLGANDAGLSDHEVGVLRLDDTEGTPIAVLLNYAVQSAVMDGAQGADGGHWISADLAGAAVGQIERHYGGAVVAPFLVGAAGDQAPYLVANRHVLDQQGNSTQVDIHDQGFVLVELLGERLGSEALRVSQAIRSREAPRLQLAHERIAVTGQASQANPRDKHPTRQYTYVEQGAAEVPVWILTLGEVAVVGLQAELSSATGLEIKRRSPYAATLVVTMVNGAAKYLPDAASYQRFTYEAQSARYAKGAAETVATGIVERLQQLHAQATP